MKRFFIFMLNNTRFLIILSCMNNYTMEKPLLGTIDQLMIAQSMEIEGYNSMKRKIERHEFSLKNSIGARGILYYKDYENPFSIKHTVYPDDTTIFAQTIFYMVKRIRLIEAQQGTFTTYRHALDLYTDYNHVKNSQAINCFSFFCDKEILLKTLEKLHQNKLTEISIQ